MGEKNAAAEKEIAVLQNKLQAAQDDNEKLLKTYEQEVEALKK